MLDNETYNLLQQLVTEHESLWRIKKEYLADAGDCEECNEFWKRMEKDKEGHIKEIVPMLKAHLEGY